MSVAKSLGQFSLFKKNPQELNIVDEKELGLDHYLITNPLASTLPLSHGGNFYFHWGDWVESCQFQQEIANTTALQEERFNQLEVILSDLKIQPVWVNNRDQTTKMTLYDLYNSYQVQKIRDIWFADKESRFQISFSGEEGPYIPLNSMRWFDKEVFSCFIFKKILLEGKFNRNFRLGVDTPVICQFDESMIDPHNIKFHQITPSGIMFKVLGIEAFNRFLVSQNVRLEFGVELFKQLAKAKNGKQYKKILANEEQDLSLASDRNVYNVDVREVVFKYGNLKNYRSSTSREFFLFMQWGDLVPEGKQELDEIMDVFVDKTEKVFSSELQKIKIK